ncbi:MAG: hypothetical protein HOW73_31050, partial [Polyangiaceae bacterium]|nr:hypothetical protein [Polyangiaceae bacterium]
LILIRYRAGGGNRDFELHRLLETLEGNIARMPAGASVTAFRDRQLPHRGVVNDEFIERAIELVPDGVEYLLLEQVPTFDDPFCWYHHATGTSHEELRADLEDSSGVPAAFGHYPPFLCAGDRAIQAYVPDEDGVIRPGPY